MQEKSFHEIEMEYQRRKLETQDRGGRHGHWEKCPMCEGTLFITCDSCTGSGQNSQLKRAPGSSPLWGSNATCSVCKGERKIKCRNPQCRGGWVWMKE